MDNIALALIDVLLRPFNAAAGDGNQRGVLAVTDGMPVLAGDTGSTQNASAAGSIAH